MSEMNVPTEGSKTSVSTAIQLLLGGVGGLVFWFGMLYPLVPRSLVGWLVASIVGVVIGVWAVLSMFAINWLLREGRVRLLRRAVAVVIALSLGAGIFGLALNAQSFVTAHFSYFGRS